MIKQIKKFLSVFIALEILIIPTYASTTTVGANEIISVNKVSDVVENKSVMVEQKMQICNTLSKNKVETNTPQEVYSNGWTNTRVNVRKEPNLNAIILTTFDINTPIEFVKFNDEWVKIKYKNDIAYMAKFCISFEKINNEISQKEIKQQEEEITKNKLNAYDGTFNGPSGKETYYNLPMNKVISYMKDLGYNHNHWIREDGCKMYGDYIMIAANTKIYNKGTILPTSLGMGMVCDHCEAAEKIDLIDIAVTWK